MENRYNGGIIPQNSNEMNSLEKQISTNKFLRLSVLCSTSLFDSKQVVAGDLFEVSDNYKELVTRSYSLSAKFNYLLWTQTL